MEYKGLKIGELCSCVFEHTEKIDFLSDESLFEYDLLFCDLNKLGTWFPTDNYHHTNNSEFQTFFNSFDKRKKEISDYLKNNRKIIFFVPYPEDFSHDFNSMRSVSREKNSFFPFTITTEKTRGARIQVSPNTIFSSFFKKYFDYFYYESIVKSCNGDPLCVIENTNISISLFIDKNTFLFPSLFAFDPIIEEEFLKEIADILFPEKVKDVYELPLWAENYLLPNEKEKDELITSLNKQKQELTELIAEETKEHSLIVNKKILITGTGKDLEFQVEKIFEELGLTIHSTIANRDDLILEYNSKIAVVEIKGVKGSAAEKHTAQLSKWVSNYHADYDKEPKGILIINPYCEELLEARDFTKFFPNQMLSFSNKREFCLITTTQLLGLYIETLEKPKKKDILIDSLFNTIGIYPNYQDWTKFIKLKK